jgi:hypothetical protein
MGMNPLLWRNNEGLKKPALLALPPVSSEILLLARVERPRFPQQHTEGLAATKWE